MNQEPLKMRTKELRTLKNRLFGAGIKARIVTLEGYNSYREDSWVEIAWSRDVHNTYRYLMVKVF